VGIYAVKRTLERQRVVYRIILRWMLETYILWLEEGWNWLRLCRKMAMILVVWSMFW
jgi:hypothetical protein